MEEASNEEGRKANNLRDSWRMKAWGRVNDATLL